MLPEMYMVLALLFLARGVPSNAQSEAPAAPEAEGEPPVHYYDVGRAFTLNCSALAGKEPIVWSKNGTAVEGLGELKGRFVLEEGGLVYRTLGRTLEDDFGNYSCAGGGALRQWQVHGRPHARLAPDTNVVEGQKLKLTCKVVGKPHPSVSWTFRNGSENASSVQEALGARAVLGASEQGVAGAELVLEAAQRSDAGVFACEPARGLAAATTVRVKDMYAALWPFLGICAEVFVLCAIILVYEKRRTKPELDDSDTDNHDQKKS